MAGRAAIGGLFFRAHDPKALSAWYETHLGVAAFGVQASGPVLFQPFRSDSDYFPSDRQWMLNLRVDDLNEALTRLAAAGIAFETRPEWDSAETGRFARVYDPEGNPIELWEPASGA